MLPTARAQARSIWCADGRPHIKVNSPATGHAAARDTQPGHCIPNLRFVFRAPTFEMSHTAVRSAPAPTLNEKQLKQLRTSLESQIRLILRRAHLISTDDRLANSNNNNADTNTTWRAQSRLFALPPAPLVFLFEPSAVQVNNHVLIGSDASNTVSLLFALLGSEPPVTPTPVLAPAPSAQLSVCTADLCDFYAHELAARSKQAPRHELRAWLQAADVLYNLLITSKDAHDQDEGGGDGASHANKKAADLHDALAAKLDGLATFSHLQCRKELPFALSQYQVDLPSQYRKAEHQAALARALKSFGVSACGPALQYYVKRLVADCEQTWKSGRQLCEATSVSGSRCALPIHSVPGEPPLAGDGDDPKEHQTQVDIVCTCACGKTQKKIDEPFAVAESNRFFVEEDCCTKSVESSIMFAATTSHDDRPLTELDKAADTDRADPRARGRNPSATSRQGTALFDETALVNLLQERDLAAEGKIVGSEMSESIPMSLSLNQTPGWKCCKIGLLSDYVASAGLKTAGFVSNANHLLPWDILVPNVSRQRQNSESEEPSAKAKATQQKGGGRKPRTTSESSTDKPTPASPKRAWGKSRNPTVRSASGSGEAGDGVPQSARAYIGYEYECCLGHRFIDSSPERRIQLSSSGTIKGTAQGLLKTDMPLYVVCPSIRCARHTRYAQLSRLHILTPKTSALKFGFAPRVQLRPARSSSSRALIVRAGSEIAWLEPDGHYSIQLPRVFAHENKAIILPIENQAMRQNMLLLTHPFITQLA